MKYRFLALALALSFGSLQAQDDDSGFLLSAGYGKFFYDNSQLDDASTAVFSFGYQFNKTWQAEIIRGNPDTEFNPGNLDIDTDWTALRALYHFEKGDSFTPYLTAGFDATDALDSGYQAVVGLGLKGEINSDFFWRLEGNYHADEGDTSILALIGVYLGRTSTAATAVAPKDSDADGVLDNIDSCPNTPSGSQVDATGCIIKTNLDTDMDGVFDHLDKCPTTPANALVDTNGCQKELTKDVSIELKINFDSDKAIVKSDYFAELEMLATFMTQYAGTKVVINGHTDSSGKAAHNLDLSTRRAEAAAKVLVEQFHIDASRVVARGHGEDTPIADNETVAGRADNRRVVADIKQQVNEKQWK
ncbi:MAG: flagellar motor protein MotB [Gammaproteobacteria bacterium]|nr:MAG: flagellar motor protein MotB [Gammaproteobacteria bacterium]